MVVEAAVEVGAVAAAAAAVAMLRPRCYVDLGRPLGEDGAAGRGGQLQGIPNPESHSSEEEGKERGIPNP